MSITLCTVKFQQLLYILKPNLIIYNFHCIGRNKRLHHTMPNIISCFLSTSYVLIYFLSFSSSLSELKGCLRVRNICHTSFSRLCIFVATIVAVKSSFYVFSIGLYDVKLIQKITLIKRNYNFYVLLEQNNLIDSNQKCRFFLKFLQISCRYNALPVMEIIVNTTQQRTDYD